MTDALSEHIHYLSMPHRSDLYRSAIKSAVPANASVVDLGCGVGVLGIFCLEAGARHVWGIDCSDSIYLAKETVTKAGLGDRYTCVGGSTFQADIGENVDALICDHVGYFGIDYGIIDMVRDAARRMLKPGGVIIPDRIELTVAGVSSDTCRDKASAWSKEIVPEHFHWIDDQARNSKYSHDFEPGELCSEPAALGVVTLDAESPEYFSFAAEITVKGDGIFDGLAGWFNAHLGADIWMTNSPLDPVSIKRSQAFFPVAEPFEVKSGDRIAISVRARSDGNFLAWSVKPPGGASVQKQSTWASTILAKNDLNAASGGPLELSSKAKARLFVLSLVDGDRTAGDIEAIVMRDQPDLMPSEHATLDFVRAVLNGNTDR
uniref:methyltransferase domain-containing protein n=1 Tax=uncultured Erythrobacter sp. TaxID=263913 RepID=UPI002617FD50|nr:class I SAM-dependent methyltransferase [uncultured Erythrobacter sp.]